jgi:hypothetical protein
LEGGPNQTAELGQIRVPKSVVLHDIENLVQRHRDDLGSLKRYRAVLTLLSGSTKLPHNIASFADIVDEFVAVFRDAPDLHKPLLKEEKRPFFVARVANYLIFFEGRHAAIPQDDIPKLSSKTPRQC